MVVKDFIPISDVKQSVEKPVQEKPSLDELTTIESPGRPSPASMLESPEIKKRTARKRKKEISEPTEIREPKRDSILIIAEKPQAAEKIASALGQARKYSEFGASYFETEWQGKPVLIASAVGHLFNLTYKAGQSGWPIYELEWAPSFEKNKSSFTRKYYELLKKISRRAKEYIIATDFDIEGEVIGWNVLRFICKQNTAKRMKFSTLTSQELKKSFESPLPEPAWGNAYAGETRHILDWLYGINLSRALMSAIKTTGNFKVLSIGRVQGPALKIIVDREKEISEFKPEPFWQVFAHVKGIILKHPKDIFDEKELEKFKNLKEGEAETKKSEEKIPPPHPFDLTTLQREAYRLYKMNPSEALQIAQHLYLDGLISYPRTSSQKIPKEIEPKKILKALEKNFPETKHASRPAPIEGKKTDPAHPSIYPTGEFKQLAGKEEKLYTLIAKRFISAFSQDAKTANKKIILTSQTKDGSVAFTASGLAVLEKGWTSVYPIIIEEFSLPDMNDMQQIEKIDIQQKETSPPNRYTPASLVTLLEKKNLGTKATRSMIIETLFERGYLDGRSIQATALGMKLIEALEKYSSIIIDENLTRQLEEDMEKIQESTNDLLKKEQEVVSKAKHIIEDIAKEFKVNEREIGLTLLKGIEEIRREEQQSNTLMPCPLCKQGMLRILYSKKSRRYFVACNKYPECKQTYSLPPNALIKKSGTQCPADQFSKLLAIRKGRRPWEFCFNPLCEIEKEKREARDSKSNYTYSQK